MNMHGFGLPWWNWALQFAGAVCAFGGAVLNARLKIQGFYLWITANVLLCIVHAAAGLWLLCVLDIVYVRINLTGIEQWERARRQAH